MPRMSIRTDGAGAGCSAAAAPSGRPAAAPASSPAATATTGARPLPLPETPGAWRPWGAGARSGGAPAPGLPEAPGPNALPLAGVPDVMCGLPMANAGALLSIMGYGQRVQAGVPITRFYC